jgi:hypothetical protein
VIEKRSRVSLPRPYHQPGHAVTRLDAQALGGLAEEGQGRVGPGLDQPGSSPGVVPSAARRCRRAAVLATLYQPRGVTHCQRHVRRPLTVRGTKAQDSAQKGKKEKTAGGA